MVYSVERKGKYREDTFLHSGMIQKIHTPVSVTLFYNHRVRQVTPTNIVWNGREYDIIRIGLHHTYRIGRTLFHIFSVETDALFFKLVYDTDSLHWILEEIADGEPN